MIPRPSQALADLATKLALGVAPETRSAYAMANTGLISLLLLAMAQDHDRAAANRLADIDDLKALFQDAAEAPGHPARQAFCAAAPDGYRISQLDAFHARGFELLIDLHAWAETADPALNLRIWDFLRVHTERNRFDLPGP